MSLILYMANYNPSSRAVLITADLLKIDLVLRKIDTLKKENYSDEYSKINPYNSIPTLVDGKLVICDSHSINIYLIKKYGKNDMLYPQDVVQCTVINERLFFESTFLCPYLKKLLKGKVYKRTDLNFRGVVEEITRAYSYLEIFLEKYKWMAGGSITLADVTLLPVVDSLDVLVPIDDDKFPRLKVWIKRAQALPEFKMDDEGLQTFKSLVLTLYS
jgi:glutathione S-transferase